MSYSREQIEQASTPEELAALLAAAGSQPRWIASSLAEVAEFFQIAVSTAKGWSQEGMPNAGDGWSLPAIVRWRIARLAGDDLATARKRQEIELNAIAIETKRLDLARDKGELVDRGDVERTFATAVITLREVVMSIPDAIATSAPPELREVARSEADAKCRAGLAAAKRALESQMEGEELESESTTGEADGNEPTKEEPDQ